MAETRLAPPQTAPPAGSVPAGGRLAALEWALLAAGLALAALGEHWPPGLVAGAWLLAGAWLARWRRLGSLTRPTPLDGPLLLLALSALVALWVAPNTLAALARLVLLAGALTAYYTLANMRGRALRQAALTLVAAGGALAAAYLLGLTGDSLHRNDVAAAQAMLAPLALALLLDSVSAWNRTQAPGAALTALLVGTSALLGLAVPVLARSRTVLLGAAVVVLLAAWWWLAGRLSPPGRRRQGAVFGLGLALAVAVLAAVLAWQPAWLVEPLRSLPGEDPTTGLGRFVLFGQAWQLAQATPFTGGGLGAFPALFATYLHDLPSFLLAHAHNSYLNLLVEQGWPGLAALLLALASAAWVAVRALAAPPTENRPLLWAGAAGLVMVAVHGLGDASLVATWAAPLLLVPAGLVAAAAPRARTGPAAPRPAALLLGMAVAGLALLLVLGGRPLASAWEANLGAVAHSRAWLSAWPTGQWRTGTPPAAADPARQHYQAALRLNPRSLTALYGLGLLAREAQDFEAAAAHLEQALTLAPAHRGVRKVLGYTYVWLGRLDDAEPLLSALPEARRELTAYAGWWPARGRPDLAALAAQMASRLEP